MLYVGLDIHDKRIAICVLGESAFPLDGRMRGPRHAIFTRRG